jgi:hypothetical protein
MAKVYTFKKSMAKVYTLKKSMAKVWQKYIL